MDEMVKFKGAQAKLRDLLNPQGMFKGGQRVRDYSIKDMPAFSAKLMQEFDKRRSIKDMFGRGTSDKGWSGSTRVDQSNGLDPSVRAMPSKTSTGFSTADYDAVREKSTGSSHVSRITSHSTSLKRQASKIEKPAETHKRKRITAVGVNVSSPDKQKSLRGFFNVQNSVRDGASLSTECGENGGSNGTQSSQEFCGRAQRASIQRKEDDSEHHGAIAKLEADEPIIDPEASKATWSKLLSRPNAPPCEHGEPCKVMKTKKPGFNCGREFWMCQRSVCHLKVI